MCRDRSESKTPANGTVTTIASPTADNQTAVTVMVYQGERPMAKDNRLLGQFNLEGIPPAPRGVPQIEVKFDIDANGILNVSAKDLGTNKEASVRIEQSSGLSEDEINRMQRDAEEHAAEDKRRRELAEARNRGDALIYETEKVLKEHGERLSDTDKQAVNTAMEKVRESSKGEEVEAINRAIDELQQASHALSQHLYQQQQQAGAQTETPQEPAGEEQEDVVDADFEVKE